MGKVLPLLLWERALYQKPCRPISKVTDEIRDFADDLKHSCYGWNGVGLAAPQVNQFIQMAFINFPQDKPFIIMNPKILPEFCKGEQRDWEGCLSFPGESNRGRMERPKAKVTRSNTIRYEYLNMEGDEVVAEATGMQARVIQHEVDHLNGIFFIDRCGSMARDMVLRKFNRHDRHLVVDSGNGTKHR